MRNGALRLGLLSALGLGLASLPIIGASAAPVWITVPNSSLEVEEGSALDLSGLTLKRGPSDTRRIDVKAGSEDFTYGGAIDPDRRFFCATMGFGINTGRFPPVEEAERWAKAVRRAGYNAVRLHMIELALMEGRTRDFDFDPVQLDRFDHLLAALRAEGISYVFDLMSSWNGAYGDVGSNRWIQGRHDTKAGTYFPGPDRDHWLKLVDLLWARPNPLTGITPLADPATIGVVLVNESEIDFIGRKGIGQAFVAPFHDWLLRRYGSEEAVAHAWGAPFDPGHLPRVEDTGPAGRDFQTFATEIQLARVAWMRQALRDRGYGGPITDFDTQSSNHSAVSRRALSFVDMHGYADSPAKGMVEPGTTLWSRQWGGNLLDGKGRYFDLLSWARLEGQPFTVTEYGMSFWSPLRFAVAPMTAAQARLQNWKLICHFGTPIALSRPARGRWQEMLVPFNVGQDPTLRSGETIAAFLFGRGDVHPSDVRVVYEVPLEAATGAPASESIDWFRAKAQNVVSVATTFRGAPPPAGSFAKRFILPAEESSVRIGPLFERLRRAGIVADDGSDPAAGSFRSSTGELDLDTHAERFTVVTRGTVGLVSRGPAAVSGSGWKLSLVEGEAAVFVSDLGAGDLAHTRRALLVISTDARNTGMTFSDTAETVLAKIGHFPVQIRDATVHLEFDRPGTASQWKLYAIDFTGRRRRALDLTVTADGRLSADVRLSGLGDDVTPYFELTAGSRP